MRLSEIAREVISNARAVNQARAAECSDDDSPLISSSGDISTMKPPTAEEKCLREFLQTQSAAVIYMLTAIMYLGRGDFDSQEDLLDRYTDMGDTFGDPRWAARQMMEKVPLPKYLEEGLKRLVH